MNMRSSNKILSVIALVCFATVGCSSHTAKETPPALKGAVAKNGNTHAKITDYFLEQNAYADFKVTIPEPPAANSALFKNDIEVYKKTRKLKNTKIWEDAKKNADFSTEKMCRYFSEAAGVELSKEKTPWTYYLIANLAGDAFIGGTGPAKKFYNRVRPYVYFKDRTCSTKEDDDNHIKSGSYPSGHTTYGELLGLVLSELLPQKQNEIISAANQYGYYRVICGFHWASDIEAARKIAAYENARLHADPAFLHAVEMAKLELKNQK